MILNREGCFKYDTEIIFLTWQIVKWKSPMLVFVTAPPTMRCPGGANLRITVPVGIKIRLINTEHN